SFSDISKITIITAKITIVYTKVPRYFPMIYRSIIFIPIALQALIELFDHLLLPFIERARQDVLARLAHQPQVEIQVMQGRNLRAKNLLRANQVAQVGFAVDAVSQQVTFGVDGRKIVFPLFV